MSGHLPGAQTPVREKYRMAVYVHRRALPLNLALVDSYKYPYIRHRLGMVTAIGTFF